MWCVTSDLGQLLTAPLLVRTGTGSKSKTEPLSTEQQVVGEDGEVWTDLNHATILTPLRGTRRTANKIRFANLMLNN